MKLRFSLFSKVLFLAFLNLCLLGLVFLLFARLQFRLDAGSFLLAPAQNRITAMAHMLAMELDEIPASDWDGVLQRYSEANGVVCTLFDEEGHRVAGQDLLIPPEVAERIPRRQRPPRDAGPPDRERPRGPERPGGPPRKAEDVPEKRAPAPPLFLTAAGDPVHYWAGARIPLRRDRLENPKPGTLVLVSASIVASPLFFDPKPWLAAMLVAVLVSVVCWLPFIRGMTRSISQMTRVAEQIAEGRFNAHVDDRRGDEIGRLGESINRMAQRLAGFVNGQKRFLGGIAHELCTPIATIQFGLGNLERRVAEEEKERVEDIQEEVQHMSALVNELLSFSKAEMPGVNVKLSPVNVASTVARVLEREAPSDRPVDTSVDPGHAVMADEQYLFRALSNLVRNAVRYAGAAGPIHVSSRAAGGRVFLVVADQGPGVPESALDEIFAPFYRLDDSRSQETGGIGLGLAIVKSCIEACQGVVRCRNRKPSGLEVEIELQQAVRPL